MAEPISIAASIGGLITLAEVVVHRLYKYGQAVAGAKSEISKLALEITTLFGVLQSVKLVVSQMEGEGFEITARLHQIFACQQTLEKIKLSLDKHDPSKCNLPSALKRKLKWPFSSLETELWRLEVENHKSNLTLALSADNMSFILQLLSCTDGVHQGITEIKGALTEITTRLEAQTRIAMDQDRERVLDFLCGFSPRLNHETGLRIRHPATGIWLTKSEEFQGWLRTKNSKLFLYGIPGAGKTILAASVIEESLRVCNVDNAVAYFYCDYKHDASQDAVQILGSIARQIARQDEQCFKKAEKLYKRQQSNHENLTRAPSSEMVRDLILEMAVSFENVMVLVDGLDECGDGTSEVVELLASLNTKTQNIKTLFLSRDHVEICDALSDYVKISIAARSSDLRLYVGAEIEKRSKKLRIKNPSLKEAIMERLIEGADGM